MCAPLTFCSAHCLSDCTKNLVRSTVVGGPLEAESEHALTRGLHVCRDLAINLDEGAMPWTCLPGEPSNINWCNAQDQSDLYHNPPAAWRGASYQGVIA